MANCVKRSCGVTLAMQVSKFYKDLLSRSLDIPGLEGLWLADQGVFSDEAATVPATNNDDVKAWVDASGQITASTSTAFNWQYSSISDPTVLKIALGGDGDRLEMFPGIDISDGAYTIITCFQQTNKTGNPYLFCFSTNQNQYNDGSEFAGGVWTSSGLASVDGMGIYNHDPQVIRQTDTDATGAFFIQTYQEDLIRINGVDVGDPGGIEYTDQGEVDNLGVYFVRIGTRSTNQVQGSLVGVAVFSQKITTAEMIVIEDLFNTYVNVY